MPEASDLRLNWPPRNDGTRGPSERQAEFLQCGAHEQLYGGSKRGGKTVAGCAKGIYLSFLIPGNRGFILRNAFTDLRESTLTTFFQLCPPELIIDHNKTEHHILLKSVDPDKPSMIVYAGMGEQSEFSPKAKEKAKSKESGWFWIDEPSEVNFDAFRMMLAQLCWFLPNGQRPPYMALLTSNPEPGWVYDRYIDENADAYIMGKDEVDAEFIPSLPSDNPGLPPSWEKDMRATMDADWVKRYLDGSWEIHEGMVFTELSEVVHNLDRYLPPGDPEAWAKFHFGMTHVGALDHASTGITAYLRVGIDSGENMFALEEYYKDDGMISEHAQAIAALDSRYGQPKYRLIDPSTEGKTLQNSREMFSVQEAYINAGGRYGDYPSIPTVAAHRANISVGIDLLKQYLHFNLLHRNPFTQQLGSPRLFISKSRCPMLWKEMHGLKKELRANGSIDFVGRDHAVDDLRYIAMSRPGAPVQKEKDLAQLPTQDAFAIRSHDKWAGKWGPKPGNRWY